ncbi:L,D-transpeptidase [Paenibacillus donghaensis]|uniref:L,D-TPase catalytic domain-containing protein n=1 Tax=Paenibacillus donghaensis TaxID=414771 RepID=A0A2Z2KPG2_9BACL|nr:L,D-transpeptidase [Paenibacillus donghaensis]ASA20668.1 hypothetical protein B9T62_07610 [Paenibacillus donghaensis]
MKNSHHLKAYVQLHPDNKMAWYLLGKEYHKNGQQGKANYCFNQAGEVYEAFEHSKVPAEMLREYEDGLLQAGRQRDERRARNRRWLLALAVLLLVLLPSAVTPAPGGIGGGKAEEVTAAVDAPQAGGAALEAGKQDDPADDKVPAAAVAFTAQESGSAADQGRLLKELLPGKEPAKAAVLGMKRSGKWLLWEEKLPLEYVLEKTGDGAVRYQSYNAAACACEPPEAGPLQKQAAAWQAEQESLAALWSAMAAYSASKGTAPASVQQLAGDFPGNWIGGTTEVMEQAFSRFKAAGTGAAAAKPLLSASPAPPAAGGNAADKTGSQPAAAGAAAGKPFLAEPLRIIVDKTKHRLAIASGNVIVRNYEVGLGGDRTPEGSYSITDKVVNPNGRDNGEFGSRGLQLSDARYAIHGTDEPESIGKDESLGCIRMNRADVEELFALVPMGTSVLITKGVLPDELQLPEDRYTPAASHDQTNPRKVYHWLN